MDIISTDDGQFIRFDSEIEKGLLLRELLGGEYILVDTLEGAQALLTETTLRMIRKSAALKHLDAPEYTISEREANLRGIMPAVDPELAEQLQAKHETGELTELDSIPGDVPEMPEPTPIGEHGSFGVVAGPGRRSE